MKYVNTVLGLTVLWGTVPQPHPHFSLLVLKL